jgi:predicted ribosome quality control (RQC) complex YloA/Tae2 family protein
VPEDDEPGSLEETVEAYERQKRAQLSDQGREPLVKELAKLEHFLDQTDRTRSAMEDIVEFRRRKAEVLRAILAETQ